MDNCIICKTNPNYILSKHGLCIDCMSNLLEIVDNVNLYDYLINNNGILVISSSLIAFIQDTLESEVKDA